MTKLAVRDPAVPDDLYIPDVDEVDFISPLVKCPGGKRELAARIASLMPETITHFMEPFFGGGAVFFHLYKTGRLAQAKSVDINDYDRHLIELYEDVKRDAKDVHTRMMAIAGEYAKNPEATYYHVRKLWNQRNYSAAKNLFLRYTGFNGLWRENKAGGMNTPWGKYAKPAFPSIERLEAVANAFRRVTFESEHFAHHLEFNKEQKQAGTVMYLDPPYDCDFVQYTKHGFSRMEQEALLKLCAEWSEAGARIVYSNADTPFVRDTLSKHWPKGTVESVEMKRRINSDAAKRGPVGEVLVWQ